MSVGDVAGLIAAIAFVLLVGALAVPLLKLGGVLDETRSMIKGVSDETVPLLSEVTTTVTTTNAQLVRVDAITSNVQAATTNVSRHDRAVRRHPRRPGGQGRRVHLRGAQRHGRPAGHPDPPQGGRPDAGATRPRPSGAPARRDRVGRLMRRLFWVAVGAAAGVYAVRKVQQTLHAYSPGGLAERATGVGASWQAFTDEVRRNAAEREAQLREALGMEPPTPPRR